MHCRTNARRRVLLSGEAAGDAGRRPCRAQVVTSTARWPAAGPAAILLLVLGTATNVTAQDPPQRMRPPQEEAAPRPSSQRVAVPVLDVRAEPTAAGPTLDHDLLQETQLLYGERVLVYETRGGWARIEAPEQLEWSHHQHWEGYPGWVDATGLLADDPSWIPTLVITDPFALVHRRPLARGPYRRSILRRVHEDQSAIMKLSLGTQLVMSGQVRDWWHVQLLDGREGWIRRAQAARLSELATLPPEAVRQRVCDAARRLLNTPYYWGGRSANLQGQSPTGTVPKPPHTAVDCSGLTNLCYRAAGMEIPRDAHEQSLRAAPIAAEALHLGDLVFLTSAEDAARVTHVMLYVGHGRVIEGPGTGQRVRETTLEIRRREAETQGCRVRYGTYFPE